MSMLSTFFGSRSAERGSRRRRWTVVAAAVPTMMTTLVTGLLVGAPAAQAAPSDCSAMNVLAHRGYHYTGIAENTAASFDAAAARGYDIETDVWADAEGQLWIFHDRNPLRATGVSGQIDKMTTAQVSALRYKKTGEPLPRFQDALTQFASYASGIRIYIEPKNNPTAQAVGPLVRNAGIESRVWYTAQQGFYNNRYPNAHTMARSYDSVPDPSTFTSQGYDEVTFNPTMLNPDNVAQYHAAGLEVQIRTTNATRDWREAIKDGVDSILTDKPDEFRAFCPVALNAPTISSFTPDTANFEQSVTITGADLTDATRVAIGGVASTFTVDSSTQITAQVPARITGSVSVAVTTPNGTATAPSNLTIPLEITSVSSTTPQRGESISIYGRGLNGANRVRFGSIDGTNLVVVSDTQITVTVPAEAPPSSRLAVRTPSATVFGPENIKIPPKATSFTPTSGPSGTAVTLSGSGFTGVSAVKFGGVATSFTVDSDTQITTSVPSGFVAPGQITLTSPGGTTLSAASFGASPATISSFSPGQGIPGTVVTITGTNFTGTSGVQFGTVDAASFTVDSSTQITATAPTGMPDSAPLTVVNPNGSATSSTNFDLARPVISGFSPSSGGSGTPVVITGSGLSGASSVMFGRMAATSFTVDNDGQITAIAPAGLVRVTIKVTTPGGSATSTGTFSSPAPVISSFTPTSGAIGTTVTITGNYFTGATVVRFGSIDAVGWTVDSDTQITAVVPEGAPKTGKIRVSTPVGSTLSATTFIIP